MSIESSLKLIEYVSKVAKEPILVNGEPYGNPPPKSVTIKSSFFKKDDCVMCGRCCVNETAAYTAEGMRRVLNCSDDAFAKLGLDEKVVPEFIKGLEEITYDINGKSVKFWIYPKDSKEDANKLYWPDRGCKTRCHWLIEVEGTYRCSIHPIRPITCAIPHMRFMYSTRSHNVSIGTYQYGRNHRLGCPIKFEGFDEKSVQTKLIWLKRLLIVADDLGVDTFLPEIIRYIESGARIPTTFYPETHKKLFSIGGEKVESDKQQSDDI